VREAWDVWTDKWSERNTAYVGGGVDYADRDSAGRGGDLKVGCRLRWLAHHEKYETQGEVREQMNLGKPKTQMIKVKVP